MAVRIDIDPDSGFCGGVIRAIRKAEDCLAGGGSLYSLGAIVHNEAELQRLESKGMVTIDKEDIDDVYDAGGAKLLIRAHGEPPITYENLKSKGFEIVDCTCPVVLKLQQSIRQAWIDAGGQSQIIIFGKVGHAEVLGLLGQIGGNAVVIEDMQSLGDAVSEGRLDLARPVEIFSQTTKSPDEYEAICARIEELMASRTSLDINTFRDTRLLRVHNTICSQVASRHARLIEFAQSHDIIIFVSGKASSNGKVLCELCKEHNIRTYHIDSMTEIRKEWFRPDDKVGVCGATSTPKWLLEEVAQKIWQIAE